MVNIGKCTNEANLKRPPMEVLTFALPPLSFALKKIRDNRQNPWLKNCANEPNFPAPPTRK
jgi:hypothetical protein